MRYICQICGYVYDDEKEKEYKFLFSEYEISFSISENKATILNIQKIN